MANAGATETFSGALKKANHTLHEISDSPSLDSQLLLAHVIGEDRQWFYAHGDEFIDAESLSHFQTLVQRRQEGEPVAYIIGKRDFWRSEFIVTADTLVPRPETELIIETVLALPIESQNVRVLDLGTGTGAIAITLAIERLEWQVTATDISAATLAIAKQNGKGIANLNFIESNWFDQVNGNFDLIISNPPYLRADDSHLASLRFEPRLALAAGPTGLECFKQIIEQAHHYLAPDAQLVLEHGYDQRADIIAMLIDAGLEPTACLDDLAGQPRVIVAGIKNSEIPQQT